MPRSISEMEADASKVADAAKDAKRSPAPMEITSEEAHLLVAQHSMNRVRQGRIAPDHKYVMKKIAAGKVKLHGVQVVVKEKQP